MFGTAEYHQAKYIGRIINENKPMKYMLDSYLLFISQLSLISSHVLANYDVESLLTNIPLQETIEDVCKHVCQQNDPPKYPNEIFRMLLEIATGGYFLNKCKLYCQIVLPNWWYSNRKSLRINIGFFLAQLENQFMYTNLDFLLAHYCRYVDDIFCVFDSLENVNNFFFSSAINIQI